MNECRFFRYDMGCEQHENSLAALCTHAAAALQACVDNAEGERNILYSRNEDLQARVAELEREVQARQRHDAKNVEPYICQLEARVRELEAANSRDKRHEEFLLWRSVEIPCKRCGGSGVITYADTSTWRRGGVAGQQITSDVCDTCWGSGDAQGRGANLRELVRRLSRAEQTVGRLKGAAEMLWVVLANVSGGDWKLQSEEWQRVAARWRDNYFAALAEAGGWRA